MLPGRGCRYNKARVRPRDSPGKNRGRGWELGLHTAVPYDQRSRPTRLEGPIPCEPV